MKTKIASLPLAILMIALCAAPIAAQGVTAGFTIYLTFFYPYHFLYNLQVTIRDQTGRIVASALSPDGSLVIIPIRTETPIYWLRASASGYASVPYGYYYFYSVTNPGFWRVSGASVIPVEVVGGDYWMTISLS